MASIQNPHDPKGLIRESYAIAGISEAECKSILMDWALSLPQDHDVRAAIMQLLEEYGQEGHPMTGLLREGLGEAIGPGLRRGRRAK